MKGAFLTFQKDADQIYPGWKEKLGYTGESSVQAASFDWKKKSAAAAFVGESSAAGTRKQSAVALQALDQSSRYAALDLSEEELIRMGKHVLVAYIMKPKPGYDGALCGGVLHGHERERVHDRRLHQVGGR